MARNRNIIVIGAQKGCAWPEPLAGLIACGRLELQPVDGLHEAAAAVIFANPNGIHGMLVEVGVLPWQDLAAWRVFQEQTRLPVWLLPWNDKHAQRAQQAMQQGVGSWDDAVRALGVLAEEEVEEGPGVILKADNHVQWQLGVEPRFPVTADPGARYDDSGSDAILSEQEIRALLGAAE